MYKKFEYYEPKSISEAIEVLKQNPSASILNGGTDVVVRLNQNNCAPVMVNIKYLSGLDKIEEKEDGMHIGALVRHIEIMENPILRESVPVLVEAVKTIGTPQVRNRGTLSGNLCNASPVADSMGALQVLDAKIVVCGVDVERIISACEFQTGPGKTVLKTDELVKEIVIPFPKKHFYAKFEKLGPRKAADIAIVNVTAGMETEDGICKNPKVALGAVAPKVIRAEHLEAYLKDKRLDEIDIEKAANIAAYDDASPISDFRSTKEYRTEMVEVLIERALSAMLGQRGEV